MAKRYEVVHDVREFNALVDDYIKHGYVVKHRESTSVDLRKRHIVSPAAAFWWFILGFIGFIIYIGIYCPAKPHDRVEVSYAPSPYQDFQVVRQTSPYGSQNVIVPSSKPTTQSNLRGKVQ